MEERRNVNGENGDDEDVKLACVKWDESEGD